MVSDTDPMLALAERYADELSAQFRTLNYFVVHAGEIGRAHETYLRGVIARFLPAKCRVGTGFVASSGWVSSQQDIIVYNRQDFPILFEVGDCIVVDYDAVGALIEVKTSLKTINDFSEAFIKLTNLYEQIRHSKFVGLFAWEGLNLDSILDSIWSYIRADPMKNLHQLPSAIYVRGKYLLLLNEDGRRDTPPFHLLDIARGNITEGQAILSLIAAMWISGLQLHANWPWWLESWWHTIPTIVKPVSWPDDLSKVIKDSLKD